MSKQDGGPAFPVARGTAADGSEYTDAHYPGMTLRDYFAGQALAGLLAQGAGADPVSLDMMPRDVWAHSAYALADAMLAERDKE